MARNVNTKFNAHALPLALLLLLALAQGGSCQKGAAGANAANAAGASPAGAQGNRAAAANSGDDAGEGDSDVNRSSEAGAGDDVAAGVWGGEHVRLQVKGDGAEVEFDCAHGRISGRLRLSSDGRFDAPGTFVIERGGPIREGAREEGQPARYAGQVKGKTMTLSVRLTNSNDDAGTFTLTHGREPQLTKCL